MIEVRGAPYDLGREQGRVLAEQIRFDLKRIRENDRAEWRRRVRHGRDGAGLRAMRFLPQHHERLQGIADAARVSLASLIALDGASPAEATAGHGADGLSVLVSARVPLFLRRTVPEVGGFTSVELTAAPFAGSLAGVNSEGLAVVCVRDRESDPVLGRLLAQELLLRGQSIESTVDHARRRGAYLGGCWRLVVGDDTGRTLRLEQGPSGFRLAEGLKGPPAEPGIRLTIDPTSRSLTLFTDPRPETLSAVEPGG